MIQLAAWLAALVLAGASAAGIIRAVRRRSPLNAAGGAMLACLAFTVLGLAGDLSAGRAAALALPPAAAALLLGRSGGWRATVQAVGKETAAGIGRLVPAGRSAWRGALVKMTVTGGGTGGLPAGEARTEAVAQAVASRAIPPVREDPVLGPMPEPAALAMIAPVPAPFAALAQWIGSFEPEDDQALRLRADESAAGWVALADATHACAENLLDAVRLHPAYVAGHLELADSVAEVAAVTAQVHVRFAAIYGAIQEWVSGNGPLPKDGDFLTGEGT